MLLTNFRALQQIQPSFITSQIIQALGSPNSATTSSTEPPAAEPKAQIGKRAQHQSQHYTVKGWTMALGVPWLTGMIEIRRPEPQENADNDNKNTGRIRETAANGPGIGLRIRLPTWLSLKVADYAVQHSPFFRTHHLRIYNVHPMHSQDWSVATAAIAIDDVDMLRQRFEHRTLTPFDTNYHNDTLLSVSRHRPALGNQPRLI